MINGILINKSLLKTFGNKLYRKIILKIIRASKEMETISDEKFCISLPAGDNKIKINGENIELKNIIKIISILSLRLLLFEFIRRYKNNVNIVKKIIENFIEKNPFKK
tara:strand:+ start:46 stop:369 length:324 start_codon:yes stop_codon:yes gene_type:complete